MCIDAGNPGASLGEELMSVPLDPGNIWGENVRVNMVDYSWWVRYFDGRHPQAELGGATQVSAGETPAIPGDLDRDGVMGLGDLWVLVNDWLIKKQL